MGLYEDIKFQMDLLSEYDKVKLEYIMGSEATERIFFGLKALLDSSVIDDAIDVELKKQTLKGKRFNCHRKNKLKKLQYLKSLKKYVKSFIIPRSGIVRFIQEISRTTQYYQPGYINYHLAYSPTTYSRYETYKKLRLVTNDLINPNDTYLVRHIKLNKQIESLLDQGEKINGSCKFKYENCHRNRPAFPCKECEQTKTKISKLLGIQRKNRENAFKAYNYCKYISDEKFEENFEVFIPGWYKNRYYNDINPMY